MHNLADAEAAVRKRRVAWRDRVDLAVAVLQRATGRLLGEAGLGPDWDTLTFELGFWLRPSAVGHGYMTEANTLMRDWAFRGLAARRVVMSCDSQNVRSVAVARRIGLNQVKAERLESKTLLTFELTAKDYRAHATA